MAENSQLPRHDTNNSNTSSAVFPVAQLPLGTVLIPAGSSGAETSVSSTMNLAQVSSTGHAQPMNMNASLNICEV